MFNGIIINVVLEFIAEHLITKTKADKTDLGILDI